MKSLGINLIWITVRDIKAAIKFYTEIVGLELVEFHEQFGWAELKGKEGASLGLAQYIPEEKNQIGENAIVTLSVENIETAVADLKSKNVHLVEGIIEVPGAVRLQTFKDADGNTFQLAESIMSTRH